MARLRITDLFVYRWRYFLGYGITIAILIASLILAGLFIPGGITNNEMASTVTSTSIEFETLDGFVIINLPYHLLQLASANLLGISTLSIKLPSLILGLFTAMGLILLLRRWFHYNVAVIAALVAISTSQFLFIAQNGTPLIMYLFWSVWLLLTASKVSQLVRPVLLWRYLFFILAALSLYTPLSIYIMIAIVLSVALHPHLRYLFRRIPASDVVFGAVIGSLLLIPLGYAIATDPSLGLELLGFSNTRPDFAANGSALIRELFDFTGSTIASTGMMMPLFGLSSALLIAVGAFSLLKARHSVKTYLIILWLVLLIPAVLTDPALLIIAFVPFVLLLASGLQYLIQYWYRLFPNNPYARIAGLVPLTILVGGLVFTGLDNYSYGYYYNPDVASKFSRDIDYLNNALARGKQPTTLVVSDTDSAFYMEAAERISKDITVTSVQASSFDTPQVIIAGDMHTIIPEGKRLDQIITNNRSKDSDRVYVYKNPCS